MKKILTSAVLVFLLLSNQSLSYTNMTSQDQKLIAVEGVPFSALIYFEDDNEWRYDIRLIMAPDQVSEKHIRLLAKALSIKYPAPKQLLVLVDTDLREPALALRGIGGATDPGEGEPKATQKEIKEIEISQWVFYTRREDVELFRYNPSYPKSNGMKTVILRGKE